MLADLNPDLTNLLPGLGRHLGDRGGQPVLERLQGRLDEVLGLCAKLPSGYQRDLQLMKAPLFRGIDLALETLAILPAAISTPTTHNAVTPQAT